MSLGRARDPFSHPDWLFEIKWDGFRSLVRVERGKCRLISRNGNEFKSFPVLNDAIAAEIKSKSVLLDGEIVSLDASGKSQFRDLLFRRGEPRFYAFDALWIEGEDLRQLPLIERKSRLRAILPRHGDRLLYCDHIEDDGLGLFQLACQHDLEAIVAKHKYAPYHPLNAEWLKIRNRSHFPFLLPAPPCHAASEPPKPANCNEKLKVVDCPAQLKMPTGFKFRILVVDDEPLIRKTAALLLSSKGYEVNVAEDGFAALVELRASLPDLIISDLKMPNMSGFELLSVVRRRFPHIPVIAISGEFDGATPEGLIADAFFSKGGYTPAQLFSRITELLDQAPIRPQIRSTINAPIWTRETRLATSWLRAPNV